MADVLESRKAQIEEKKNLELAFKTQDKDMARSMQARANEDELKEVLERQRRQQKYRENQEFLQKQLIDRRKFGTQKRSHFVMSREEALMNKHLLDRAVS